MKTDTQLLPPIKLHTMPSTPAEVDERYTPVVPWIPSRHRTLLAGVAIGVLAVILGVAIAQSTR